MASKHQARRQREARARAAEAERRAGGRQRRRRRIIIAVMAALVSVAMVVPLAAGIFAVATGGDSTVTTDTTPTTTAPPIPAFVDPGRTITGDLQCPATDGTEQRTTTFPGPPPVCIDTSTTYLVSMTTPKGEVVLSIDPSLDAEAANLFVVLAEYGYFNGLPIYTSSLDGPAISGDAGGIDAGFSVPISSVPPAAADGSDPTGPPAYSVGTVVMAADQNLSIDTRFAVITTQEVADALSADPVHPRIGQVSSGLDVLTSIVGDPAAVLGGSVDLANWIDNAIRIESVSVSAEGSG